MDLNKCLSANSITELECELIAPLCGFADNVGYYQKCSCMYYHESVAIPTLVMSAVDNTFFDPSCWPVDKTTERGWAAPIKIKIRTDHGRHIGLMFCPNDIERADAEAHSGAAGWQES